MNEFNSLLVKNSEFYWKASKFFDIATNFTLFNLSKARNISFEELLLVNYGNSSLKTIMIDEAKNVALSKFTIVDLTGILIEIRNSFDQIIISNFFVSNWTLYEKSGDCLLRIFQNNITSSILNISNVTIVNTPFANSVIEFKNLKPTVIVEDFLAFNNVNIIPISGAIISCYLVQEIYFTRTVFIQNMNFGNLLEIHNVLSSTIQYSKFLSNGHNTAICARDFCSIRVFKIIAANNFAEFEPVINLHDDSNFFLIELAMAFNTNFQCQIWEVFIDSSEFSNNSLLMSSSPDNPLSTVILTEFIGNIYLNFSYFYNNSYGSIWKMENIDGAPCLYSSENYLCIYINSTQFISNSGFYQSNCISLVSFTVQIKNSQFVFNMNENAVWSQGGALFLIYPEEVIVLDSIFIGNSAMIGGAIYIEISDSENSKIWLKNINASKNFAIQDGGFAFLIYRFDTVFKITITTSIFTNNYCLEGGGGVVEMTGLNPNMHSTFESISNIFKNNSASDGGGVISIYSNFCPCTFFQNIFENNSDFSHSKGGGVFYTSAHCQIMTESCLFINNHGISSSDISLADNVEGLAFTDMSSTFTNSNLTSKMIDLSFFSNLILNKSSFQNILFSDHDNMISCGGESVIKLEYIKFSNFTAADFDNIFILTENSNFMLTNAIFFNLTMNGSILGLFEYLNNKEIAITETIFLNIKVLMGNIAFDVSELNDGQISFRNIICQDFLGEFLKAADSGVNLQIFKLKNYQNDDIDEIDYIGFFDFSFCNVSMEEIFVLDHKVVNCDYFFGFYSSFAVLSKIFFNDSTLDYYLYSIIFSQDSYLLLDVFFANNILSRDYFIRVSLGTMIITNFSVIFESSDFLPMGSFLSCKNCINLNVSKGIIFDFIFYSSTAFSIMKEDKLIEVISKVNINNVQIIQTTSMMMNSPISILNVLGNISHCSFIKNQGVKGGALQLSCETTAANLMMTYCSYILNSCRFIENSAINSGGGYYWENSLPLEINCFFSGNTAPSGREKSSNAIKMFLLQGPPSVLYSGEIVKDPMKNLSFVTLDYYNQIVATESDFVYLTLNFYRKDEFFNNSKFLGDESANLQDGKAIYTEYGVKGKPNSTLELILWTSALPFFSPFLIPDQNHKNYSGQYYLALNFTLRPCILGEIFVEKDFTCQKCKPNYYSLDLKDKDCKECMPKTVATCLGGSSIQLLPGYWRSDILSDNVYRCNILKYGCKGGSDGDLCNVGYEGPLCGVCVYNQTLKYFRNAMGSCELCKESNYLYALSVSIIVFIILVLLIYFSIHESYEYSNSNGEFNENDITVLMNILINYLQKISIISNIEIKWPNTGSTSNSMSVFNYFGNFIGVLECPFSEFALVNDYSLFSLKRTMSTVIFFGIILGSIIFWIVKGIFWKCWNKPRVRKKILDNMIITLIATYVMGLQPMLNFYTKSLYCIEINGTFYLKTSTSLKCWEGEHLVLVYRLILSVAAFLILPPICLLYYVTKNRKLKNNRRYLLISYLVTTGYQNKYFYWEYFLLFVKILLMLLSIFLNGTPIICVMLLLIVFFIFIHIQVLVSPFQKQVYNKLEMIKISAIYLSYASNFFFFYENSQSFINFILVFIGFINSTFVVVWGYLLYCNMKPAIRYVWNSIINYCRSKLKTKQSKKTDSIKTSSSIKEIPDVKPDKKKKLMFKNKMDELR